MSYQIVTYVTDFHPLDFWSTLGTGKSFPVLHVTRTRVLFHVFLFPLGFQTGQVPPFFYFCEGFIELLKTFPLHNKKFFV